MIDRPWLFLPAEVAHKVAPHALPFFAATQKNFSSEWKPLNWKNLNFRNRIGLAGGVDKDGLQSLHWQKLGAGFVEVGTITPKPQGPNPGTIIKRDIKSQAVWNKMGFPNAGSDIVKKRLLQTHSKLTIPLFINIGKNRETTNENAANDYVACLKSLSDVASAFVINVSSPNTKGLRDLQSEESLETLLKTLRDENTSGKPLLVKLAPDMNDEDLKKTLESSIRAEIDGWILTNTTRERLPNTPFPIEGGVSGQPLKKKSEDILKKAATIIGDRKSNKLLISVGGISSADDVKRRLEMGADLVQAYSALVFQGPRFFKNLLKNLQGQ